MAATIKDVARLAEVSISTVSRVINESKPVSPEARKRVLEAVEELGYKPNEVARSLVTKKSNLIGVIVDDIGSYYVAQMLRGIEEIGRMYKYDILLCSSYANPDTECRYIQLLMQKQVEGIILISEIQNPEALKLFNGNKLPFVYLNRFFNVMETPTVTIDNEQASKKVMDHLIGLGHKNILYITQEKDSDITIEKYKIKGYKESMNSINGNSIIHFMSGNKIEDGYNSGDKIKDIIKNNNITAIFCSQDTLAIGLINYLHDCNIKIPEDISVVGYGDISLSSIYRPNITTIKEPYYDIGAVAIRRILKSITGEPVENQTINLPIQLMIRESTKEI